MPVRSVPPRMRGAFAPSNAPRSVSGSSTESHNSSVSVPPDAGFLPDDRRYAPIRPQSQPPPPQHSFPADQTLHHIHTGMVDEHAGLQQIHQFNSGQHMASGQNTPIDSTFPPFPTASQPQYAPHNAIQHPPPGPQASFHAMSEAPPDIQMMPMSHMHHQHRDSMSQIGTDNEGRSKRPMNSTAANERELRELIDLNQHRSLESIAKEVRSAEKSQKAERAKQLFAMRWLKQFCKIDKESVPRSKVYTHYTQRCGNERVDTLNPASFGKLVRVIFPGIATRRLGVRGESKYHYVNLTLVEDPNVFAHRHQSPVPDSFSGDRTGGIEQENGRQYEPKTPKALQALTPSRSSRLLADSVAFPPTAHSFNARAEPVGENPPSMGLLFAEPLSRKLRHEGDGPQTYPQSIKFSAASNNPVQDNTMNLPDIQPFLPPKNDVDLAQSLSALYRTHCTSLIDSVRFVREKQFNKVLNAFNGTMTVPVSKLFDHASIAPWIRACDWYMYQQIIKFVSQLTLQVIPPQVFTMLGNISNNLTTHLKNAFKLRPEHVLQAKLEPAVMFASLLQRLLRVNETAHAAANLLTNDEMRNGMWQDWVRSVRPKRVLESELPTCGQEETYNILTVEIRQLLEPLVPSEDVEAGTDYEGATFAALQRGDNIFSQDVNSSAENIVDRWATFLKSLPGRFPRVETRSLLQYVGSVGTAALRDITVNQAASFGGWWITKVWVDEMLLWHAEMGGFLEATPGSSAHAVGSERNGQLEKSNEMTHAESHPTGPDTVPNSATFELDFSNMPSFTPMVDGGRHVNGRHHSHSLSPSKSDQQKQMSLELDFDDSGIGMSLNENSSPSRLFLQSHALVPGHFATR